MSRRRRTAMPLPLMMARLTFASMETIARRTLMMARGTCSPAEYRRMVHEKARALQVSGTRAARGHTSPTSLLTPFLSRASANAKRLRRK
jgi:hypothetical protein